MGFIKMLFFRKGKSESSGKEKKRIEISELSQQFDSLVAEHMENFEASARDFFSEITEAKADLKRNIVSLENAKLMNDNIPVKEKHFMEGNRAAYIKILASFIKSLREVEEISLEDMETFLEDYELAAKEFAKASARPAHITNNFFGEELGKITSNLRKIEDSAKGITDLIQSDNAQNLSSARNGIKKVLSEIKKREELMEEMEKEERAYEELKREKAVFEHKILAIKKHQSFLQLHELSAKIKSVDDESKIITADFISNFLQIEKALKKCPQYDDASEKLIASYLDDPVSALLNDHDLKIVDILGKINESLKSGQIEMDDKKKEKTVQKIASLDRMSFTNFLIKYNDLQLKKSEASRILKQNNSQREIEDLQYRLDHAAEKQKRSMEKIRKMDSQIESLKIEDSKEDVEKSMAALGVPISIEIFAPEAEEQEDE